MNLKSIRFLVLGGMLLAAQRTYSFDETASDLLKRALYFANLYNWRAATPLFQQSEQLAQKAGDRRTALYAHLGTLRRDVSSSIAERSQQVADLLATDPLLADDTDLRLFALTIKGDLDGEIDQSAARQDWTAVSRLASKLNNATWVYRAEGQLGFADYYDGDLNASQRRVTSALIAANKAGDIGAEIFYLSTIAQGYLNQNFLLPAAIDYAQKARALAAANPDSGSPLVANSVLVVALAESGKAAQANQLLETFLATPNMELPERFNYLQAAGKIALGAKQYAEGIRYFEQAIVEASSVGAFRETANSQSALSQVYLSTGDLSKAEQLVRNAVSTLEHGNVLPLLPFMLDSLAQVLTAQQKYSEADAIYDQAATLQDTLIGRADSFIRKTALITGADQLYSHHFALIADHFNNPEEGYNALEQGRSRAIVDLLLSGGSTSPESIAAERAIANLRLKLPTLKSKSEINRVRQAVFIAEQSRAINPDLTIFSTSQFKPVPLRTIQQTLGASEALLEYVVAEPSSYVLVLTPTTKQIIKLVGRKTIEKLVEEYRNAVTSQAPSARQARDLYNALLSPIPQVPVKNRLIVVPDGSLNLIPFDGLVDEHGRYVVQSHVVTYAPSSTTLYLLKSKPFAGNRPNALLAVGGVPYSQGKIKLNAAERGATSDKEFGDLPNSEAEVMAAKTAIPDPKDRVLTGSAATETGLKQALAQQFGYIHLAVHAFSSANPDRASLVVLRDPAHGEDGFIQASEIVQMRIPAKLVVLSACETQVGPIQGEEGVSALSTAFLLAGARTVVSTLWPIEDQAALILMKAFYRHLGRGEPPADSMAAAKRELLAKYGSKSAPVYWAGFVVQGSDKVQPSTRKQLQASN